MQAERAVEVDYSAQSKPPYGWEVFAIVDGQKTVIRQGEGNWVDPFFMVHNISNLWGLKEQPQK